jgi:phosphatidylserine decarboxylase
MMANQGFRAKDGGWAHGCRGKKLRSRNSEKTSLQEPASGQQSRRGPVSCKNSRRSSTTIPYYAWVSCAIDDACAAGFELGYRTIDELMTLIDYAMTYAPTFSESSLVTWSFERAARLAYVHAFRLRALPGRCT